MFYVNLNTYEFMLQNKGKITESNYAGMCLMCNIKTCNQIIIVIHQMYIDHVYIIVTNIYLI